jgi:hypothetical protein
MGKAALFSGVSHEGGPFELTCSGCASRTRVSIGRLARLALPISFTIPIKHHHTWMRCPACGQRRWIRVRRA